jgi:hypothetical protein
MPPSSDNDKSASELIDDWFAALHGQARQFPRPGPGGTVRRGNVFLPPNLYRPLPTTPTRRSAKRDGFIPPSPSPIRFSTDNPDDWKTPDEWNFLDSADTPVPAHGDNEAAAHDEEVAALASVALALGSVNIEKSTTTAAAEDSQEDRNPPNLLTDTGKASPVYCQFQWKGAAGARGRGATRPK